MQLNIPCFNKLKLKFTYRAVELLESKKKIKNPNISQFSQCEIDPAENLADWTTCQVIGKNATSCN